MNLYKKFAYADTIEKCDNAEIFQIIEKLPNDTCIIQFITYPSIREKILVKIQRIKPSKFKIDLDINPSRLDVMSIRSRVEKCLIKNIHLIFQ